MKKEFLTKTHDSDNDKVLKKVVEFLENDEYRFGTLIIKRQDGKPVLMDEQKKTFL
jgi:hypothetical protein